MGSKFVRSGTVECRTNTVECRKNTVERRTLQVVHARVEYEGAVAATILNAKSLTAPKGATIPRLELLAATTVTRLATSVTLSTYDCCYFEMNDLLDRFD